jgi:hypothetical protein
VGASRAARPTLKRSTWCPIFAGVLLCLVSGGAWALEGSAAPVGSTSQPFQVTPQQGAFLDQLERDTFAFFWETTPSGTGLTPDRAPGTDVSSVAAVGFALTAYLIGAERGYVTRAAAAERTLVTLRTLWQAPQGPGARGAAGYRGLFYHFVDGRAGLRVDQSELSTIDTALLMAGVLAAQVYFDREDAPERSIRDLADELYRRVDWSWASSARHAPLLSMGWSPEGGFLDDDWRGYNEAMILYLLALGSPTHPIEPKAWEAWTGTYVWDVDHGPPMLAFGPLFGHQYSHSWIDFRGIQDPYMRARGSDYFVNSTRATYANRAYCIANPGGWSGYGELVWGLTASDGPAEEAPFRAYWARGAVADATADDGTLAPTAVGGSVPFAPEITIPTLMNLRARFGDRLYGKYGFKDAFNLTYPKGSGSPSGWFDDQYLAIDQGPILLMVENHRSGFVWDLMKRSPYVTSGLVRAGFAGGWMAGAPAVASRSAAAP